MSAILIKITNSIKNLIVRYEVRNKGIIGKVKNDNFTLISNNCWGAEIYRELGIKYRTPFVGMYIFAPDYIKMLKKLSSEYLRDMRFAELSKYPEVNNERLTHYYPIGVLGDSVEVHFIHYKTERIAREKWRRRLNRINWKNIFVQFSDRDLFEEKYLIDFDSLRFKKVFFSAKQYSKYPWSVWIEDCSGEKNVMDGKLLYLYSKKYFSIYNWLNS